MKSAVLLAGVLAAVLPFLAGCGQGSADGSNRDAAPRTGKLKVTCTVGMIADVAQTIGGEHVEVQALMGPGTDPHLYKSSERDVRALSQAGVIFYNGLNLEGKMTDTFVQLASKKRVYAMSEYVDKALLREPPDFAGHYDPHIWFDVSLWMKGAERIRDAFNDADPAHAADYNRNAAALLKEMGELHEWCKRELSAIPSEQRLLITAHDAFGYFGRAYGIEVHGIQGISTEDQAGLAAINDLVDLIVKRKVKAVFVESSVSDKNIRALVEGCKSRGHIIVIGGELFSDAMGRAGEAGGTYPGMVKHNVETVVKALK